MTLRMTIDLLARMEQDGFMPRQHSIEYELAIFHVLTGRDRRQAMLPDNVNNHDFAKTLKDRNTDTRRFRRRSIVGDRFGLAGAGSCQSGDVFRCRITAVASVTMSFI
jgi:hypothetical protein